MDEDKIKAVQSLLGVEADGAWGVHSQAALDALIHPTSDGWNDVKGSSFADPADVRAFVRCKSRGGTDQECFKVGDNGIGAWGDDCKEGSGCAVALPPEDWEPFGKVSARGKGVTVRYGDKTVDAKLKDTMPHKANIHNGAGIDMNPDTCRALGLEPPVMTKVSWKWT